MNVQSLSVCVPTKGCVNKCKFCVSRLHENDYPCLRTWGNIEDRDEVVDEYRNQFYKRLKFSRDNNCNTVMLTGTGEALQNRRFLTFFSNINKELPSPYLWVEIQTSGVMLTNENLLFLKEKIGVTTISLSLSDIFDNTNNAKICGISPELFFEIEDVCKRIKENNFNLRLSLNMTNVYDKDAPAMMLRRAADLGADQVTFRKLYSSKTNEHKDIDTWIEENRMNEDRFENIGSFIKSQGQSLEILPFGAVKYSYNGMGVVLDEDCMSKEVKDTYKYLILRENCKLYSRWDDHGSLIF